MKRIRLVIWIVVLAAAAVLLTLVCDGIRFSPEEHRVSVSYGFLMAALALVVGLAAVACCAVKANSDKAYKKLATTDLLTGLGNRYAFQELLERVQGESLPQDLIVVYMDVDELKRINDRLGHGAGDEVLCAAAAAMKASFGAAGQCFRIGGDEFFAALRTDRDGLASMLAEFDRLTTAWRGQSAEGYSVSVGVAAAADHPDAPMETLIQIADRRMYENKESRTGGTPC